MKQTTTYYDLLEVSSHADLAEITSAYLRISRELASGNSPLGATEAEFRLKLVKHAYEVLSSPSRRSDYDAGLTTRGVAPALADQTMHIEVALEATKWSPIRRLLTIIAGLMIFGMVMQIGATYMAYQRASALSGSDPASPAAEKVYLQDFYQTYGIRAASRAEADLLLADMKRKEQAEREASQSQRLVEQQEREQRRFEEDSRRLGAEVSANLRQAEQEAERARAEEIRRKEEAERRAKEEDLARRQREIERFRGRSFSSGE
ncbi:MAG: DnaJ domain-containing protein [Dechloromonas sp.]|uniref:DnaJ domain-containing protein n=1 Tax=Ferribacterium limneticum TaxID=76259 RepID=UPI001CF8E211|nr:DnaJ domain-containing protein [Ferribacterium limneticum]MBT9521530.1 DnaJ domain-containing protein [Dechloromonas sp.]UCV22719.1 DnaJ domain-containing protein [Ferribacterium limneticum]